MLLRVLQRLFRNLGIRPGRARHQVVLDHLEGHLLLFSVQRLFRGRGLHFGHLQSDTGFFDEEGLFKRDGGLKVVDSRRMVEGIGCKVGKFDPFLIELGHEGIGGAGRPHISLLQGYPGEQRAAGDADLRPLGGMCISLRLELMVVFQGHPYGLIQGKPLSGGASRLPPSSPPEKRAGK